MELELEMSSSALVVESPPIGALKEEFSPSILPTEPPLP